MTYYIFDPEELLRFRSTFPGDDNALEYARNFAISYRVSLRVYGDPAHELLAEFNRYGERVDKGL